MTFLKGFAHGVTSAAAALRAHVPRVPAFRITGASEKPPLSPVNLAKRAAAAWAKTISIALKVLGNYVLLPKMTTEEIKEFRKLNYRDGFVLCP